MSRPLRFCMITTFFPPAHFGGDAHFVDNLARALARRGHHVEVVHCLDSYRLLSKSHRALIPASNQSNLIIHRLESWWGRLAPALTHQLGFPLVQAKRIKQILAQGFDVIHYHNISLVGGPAALTYGSGIKLYTTHEFWLVCPMHILYKFNKRPCDKRMCCRCALYCRRPPQWWRYTHLLEQAARSVDLFLAPSRFCIEMHQQMGWNAQMACLPNFIPAAEAKGDDSNARPAKSYFLFVGRLEAIKGLQTIIPHFRDYERGELWIAGTGNYEPELKRLAGTTTNIRFLGYQSGAALSRLYKHAVALLVPSLCYEVSPTVILEAFQQKTPVIVRAMGGLREMVSLSQGGLLFRGGREFLEARERMLNDLTGRDQMGHCGWQAGNSIWSEETHLSRYMEIIEGIAIRKQRERHKAGPMENEP